MAEILGFDTLFAEMILGVGLALIAGNLFAWWKHRTGQRPADVEGEYRGGRVAFLSTVGLVMTIWGLASLFG